MILSVSRRTDIPRYYLDWFLKRLEEQYVLVRNPMNFHQISRVNLSLDIIDCITFWTKDPSPMLDKIEELSPYPYYVQFTINPYDNDLECNLPRKEELLSTFQKLSNIIGAERVVWRYSPVIINEKYTEDFHISKFEEYANTLNRYTKCCNFAFIDIYRKIEKSMSAMGIYDISENMKLRLSSSFLSIAKKNNIELRACGNIDLKKTGMTPAKCIDDELISKITGKSFNLKKDTNQPSKCNCISSIEVGTYNTCLNGCIYCYANQTSISSIKNKINSYDVNSPLLCSTLLPDDKITERIVKADGHNQISLF